MTYGMWCRFCYLMCFGRLRLDRLWWRLYVGLLPFAGEEAQRRREI